MAWFLHRNIPQNFRKIYIFFLAFVWLCGLLCGVGFSNLAGDPYLSMMRIAPSGSVSIVSLLSVSLLPFLFSAFAVYIHSFGLLAGLCFIKGCLFAFVSMGLFLAYDSAGWLLRLLMMFSDLCCLVPLWWCWLHILRHAGHGSFRPVLICGAVAVSIVGLDYLYVLPLLARLAEH